MEPVTRKELFMAAAAGENVSTPKPVTREEYFLSKIGGGGAGGGVMVVNITPDDDFVSFTKDKPYAEIVQAIESGLRVYAKLNAGNGIAFLALTYYETGEAGQIQFSSAAANGVMAAIMFGDGNSEMVMIPFGK